jgi:SepF-like predicted cell division protein (DUF552 family)
MFSFFAGAVLLVICVTIFVNTMSGDRSLVSMLFSVSYLFLGLYNIWVAYAGRRSFPSNLKAYVQVDQEKIIFKPTYFSKTKVIHWKDVQSVEIKLFDLHFHMVSGNSITADLAPIETDEHIKAIQEKVHSMAESKGSVRKTENILF